MRLTAVPEWATPRVAPFRGGRAADDAPPENGSAPRRRASWHPHAIVAAAAGIVVVLLGVFAYVLAQSQATSRHEAQQRFLAQATIAAGLTRAIFSATDAPEAQAATRSFGAAVVDPHSLTASAKRSNLAYAYVAGPGGRVLAASAGTPASALPVPGRPLPVAVRQALDGQPWLSDLLPEPSGRYLIEQAIPFPTSSGRRVEVLGYPAELLSGFLGSYLLGALPQSSSHGVILDGGARIVASSVPGVAAGRLPVAPFRAVVRASSQGEYNVSSGSSKGSRYVVAAPIGGSSWRVAITEPTSTLYPADVGSQRWVIWLVFAAFALAAVSVIYLLRRALQGAAEVVQQSRRVAAVNAELQATNAELDAFSYSVSHDLRAPLRAIDGFSRIVIEEDEGTLTDAQRRYLGLVRVNTQGMGDLIDDLLAFSRLASQPLTRSRVQTAELVREVEGELLTDDGGRRIEFVNGDLAPVQADPVLLRQLFANLIGNAVKYTRGREHARIEVGSEQRNGERVFYVRDNGVGFDMRHAEKLFQVFQRLHRAEDYEGTGVGLAIVQRIVTRHGGRVWAQSVPDAGATFSFTLDPGAP